MCFGATRLLAPGASFISGDSDYITILMDELLLVLSNTPHLADSLVALEHGTAIQACSFLLLATILVCVYAVPGKHGGLAHKSWNVFDLCLQGSPRTQVLYKACMVSLPSSVQLSQYSSKHKLPNSAWDCICFPRKRHSCRASNPMHLCSSLKRKPHDLWLA